MYLFLKKNIVRISLILTSFIIILLIPSSYFYIKNGALYLSIILFLFTFKKEFRFLNYINKKDICLKYIFGIILGSIFILVIISLLLITNSITLTFNKDYSLFFIVAIILFWMIQSFFEEYLLRGVIYEIIGKELGYLFAILISSFIFTLLHLGNNKIGIIAILNIFLFGLITGFIVKKEKNIYLVSGLHFIWNYLQGNILGFNVSGIETNNSLFIVFNNEGKYILNGGLFGLEGSLITLILFIIFLVFAIYFTYKTRRKPNYEVVFLLKEDNILMIKKNNINCLLEDIVFNSPTKVVIENLDLSFIDKMNIKDELGKQKNTILFSKYYFLNKAVEFINS